MNCAESTKLMKAINDGIPDSVIGNWEYMEGQKFTSTNGFEAYIYKNNNSNEYAFVIRGTGFPNGFGDWDDDAGMGCGFPPEQLIPAMDAFYGAINNGTIPPDAKINIVGHSLGGSIAALLSAILTDNGINNTAFCFNSFPEGRMAENIRNGNWSRPGVWLDPNKKYYDYTNIHHMNTNTDFLTKVGKDTHYLGMGSQEYWTSKTNPVDAHGDFDAVKSCYGEKTPPSTISTKKLFQDSIISNARPVDPLIFDLDQDNKISTTTTQNGKNFDLDNDNFAQKTAWVSGNDGILCLDRNNNNSIDNGLELFGENTILQDGSHAKGGIEALKDLDSNKDGIIDINDTQFNNLKFLKSDGTTITLSEAGIKQINLNYTTINNNDSNNNTQIKNATFIKTDGTTGNYGEFLLNQDHTESIPTQCIKYIQIHTLKTIKLVA